MVRKHFIAARTICTQYDIEYSFVSALNEFGLIHLVIMEEQTYLHQNQIGALEKILHLHNDLHLNLEGIDVVFNLLSEEENLRKEIVALKNRLRLYEDDL